MKLLKYNKFKFLNENVEKINEASDFVDFMQYGLGSPTGFGAQGYGLATDPQMSIYSGQDSPYVDYYSRSRSFTTSLMDITRMLYKTSQDDRYKVDKFLDDVDEIKDLKILRLNVNENQKLDVFISFGFYDQEFFGLYKHFNGIMKPMLKCELYSDPNYNYIDNEYRLKFDNFLYKSISNWFKPEKGFYKNLKPDNQIKDEMGNQFKIKKDSIVEVLGWTMDKDNEPYLSLKVNEKKYFIAKNNYYFFNYWFEKI
jgi:hypothetical protein